MITITLHHNHDEIMIITQCRSNIQSQQNQSIIDNISNKIQMKRNLCARITTKREKCVCATLETHTKKRKNILD